MTVRRNGLAKGELVVHGVSSCARPREDDRAPVVVDLCGVENIHDALARMRAGEIEADERKTRLMLVTDEKDVAPGYEGNRRAHRATTAIRPSAKARAQ